MSNSFFRPDCAICILINNAWGLPLPAPGIVNLLYFRQNGFLSMPLWGFPSTWHCPLFSPTLCSWTVLIVFFLAWDPTAVRSRVELESGQSTLPLEGHALVLAGRQQRAKTSFPTQLWEAVWGLPGVNPAWGAPGWWCGQSVLSGGGVVCNWNESVSVSFVHLSFRFYI